MNFRDTAQGYKKAVRGIFPRLKIKKPWIALIYPRLNWHPLIFFNDQPETVGRPWHTKTNKNNTHH